MKQNKINKIAAFLLISLIVFSCAGNGKKNEENKSDLKKNLIKGGTKNINLLIKLIKNQKK